MAPFFFYINSSKELHEKGDYNFSIWEFARCVHEWKREILETLFDGTLAGYEDLQKNAEQNGV